MPASSHHHPAVLVDDIDRAGRFYIEAFEGHWLLHPVLLEGADAQGVLDSQSTAFKLAVIGLQEGCIELFELVETRRECAPADGRRPRIPHFGIQVDDLDAALERIETAGGRRIWSRILSFGGTRVIYAADPAGNVLELTDADMPTIVDALRERYPDAVPSAQH